MNESVEEERDLEEVPRTCVCVNLSSYRGGSGPLPERGAEVPRLAPGWLDDSGLLEVRLPLVEV